MAVTNSTSGFRCYLFKLPNEVQLAVVGYLEDDRNQLLKLSATCRFFRLLLIPFVFRSITLRKDAKSGASMKELLNAGFGEHVREIDYRIDAEDPGDVYRTGKCEEADALLSLDSYNTLAHLGHFPNLETLIMDFRLGIADWYVGIRMFESCETQAEVLMAESKVEWRKLLRQTFAALASNPPNHERRLKNLHIYDLPPLHVSVWDTSPWHAFLSSFQELHLGIFGGKGGGSWNINVHEGFREFVRTLAKYFLDHVSQLTSLILEADDDGPIGLTGEHHAPLPLFPAQMPRLQSLTCFHVFVGPELVNFVTAHHNSLESLRLYWCYSSRPVADASRLTLAYNPINWAEFFTALSTAKPSMSTLRQLEVGEYETWFGLGEPLGVASCGEGEDYEDYEDDEEVIRLVDEGLEQPGRRLFSYRNLDNIYGTANEMTEDNQAAFLKGEDQKAYDNLMKMVKENLTRWELERRSRSRGIDHEIGLLEP